MSRFCPETDTLEAALPRLFPVWVLIALVGCSPGFIDPGDAGPDGDVDVDIDADIDADSDVDQDPCDIRMCPPGQECVDGRCRTIDLCDGVECDSTGEACDPRDGLCHSGETDEDADGVSISGGDCNDGDPLIHPGATEICDGVDQNCDHAIDEGFPDADGDGFDICGGGDPAFEDCDDTQARRHPGLSEACDALDNDCDGAVDEELDPRPCTTACGDGSERCEGGDWVCSAPGSCECRADDPNQEEPCGRCGRHHRSCGEDLRWTEWSACTDEGPCSPGQSESQPCARCGRESRTCDESCSWTDFGECADQGECEARSVGSCTTSCGSSGSRLCDRLCTWGGCSPPTESCNGLDDDCDGGCDEECRHPVHRSYSDGADDHFYTASLDEAGCCGYRLEIESFFYLYSSAVSGTTPLYRCWNVDAADHFMSTDDTCEGQPWMREGVIGHIAPFAFCGATPLYRLARPSDHFYTTGAGERDYAVSIGYVSEGIIGYVWTTR
jgi:hypothetical protein